MIHPCRLCGEPYEEGSPHLCYAIVEAQQQNINALERKLEAARVHQRKTVDEFEMYRSFQDWYDRRLPNIVVFGALSREQFLYCWVEAVKWQKERASE